MGLMPPQRRQAATRWQTNTTVCILCVGGSPKLGPASAEGQELDAYDTERTLSVGRTPRSVPLTTVSPPQRRQRYKICPNTDACHPQRRRSPKSRPSNDACDPHT